MILLQINSMILMNPCMLERQMVFTKVLSLVRQMIMMELETEGFVVYTG